MRLITYISLSLASLVLLSSCLGSKAYTPQVGDIIFHESKSSQSKAIQLATGSRYSHVGIVFIRKGQPYVLEAVQPVKVTPLKEWCKRGADRHYVVKRLNDAESILSPPVLDKMFDVGASFLGKDYDSQFLWSDEKIYCSELVWKIYDRGAGVQLGALKQIGDYDLLHDEVQKKAQERYGSTIPLKEKISAPVDIYNAPNLKTVFSN